MGYQDMIRPSNSFDVDFFLPKTYFVYLNTAAYFLCSSGVVFALLQISVQSRSRLLYHLVPSVRPNMES